jgi:5-methylcytosine-specific restriction protein A
MAELEAEAIKFFERTKALDPAAQDALRQLYALGEEPGVTVDFGEDALEGSMRLYVKRLSSASVVILQGDGRLMLMVDPNRDRPQIREPLAALARRLGHPVEVGWETRKPTFERQRWTRDLDAVVCLIAALARGEDAVAAVEAMPSPGPVGPTIRKATAPVPAGVVVSPNPDPTDRSERTSAEPALELRPTADSAELEQRVTALIGSGPPKNPPGIAEPRRVLVTDAYEYERDQGVRACVLDLAGGLCEACGEPAPFTRADGRPFLEVHHVVPLADGGPDFVSNSVALCPNCHRALHMAADAQKRRAALYAGVGRLQPVASRG